MFGIKKKKCYSIIIGTFCGVISFLVLYGVGSLNFQNDAWIMQGYDGSDIVQHYAGWVNFREAPWKLPLGEMNNLGTTGSLVSYTDSIPIVAILFKLFRDFLPATFQYFGIYILLCFILQGIGAALLLERKKVSLIIQTSCVLLFTFSPVMIERAFRHTALASHFLILFSMLHYLNYRESLKQKEKGNLPGGLILQNCLAIMIHPYFLPITMMFTLLAIIEFLRIKHWKGVGNWSREIFEAGKCGFPVLILGNLIGVLGSGISPSRYGYGFFSMNLNAPFNPLSCGAYTWSTLLPVLPQRNGNYDGFNYFGAGILGLFMFVLIAALLNRYILADFTKRNAFVFIAILFMTGFAITNVITVNQWQIVIPMPDWLITLCGIFRASSRMFYFTWYVVLTGTLYFLIGLIRNARTIVVIILVFVCLQGVDLSKLVIQKHEMMNENVAAESILTDMELAQMLEGHTLIVTAPELDGEDCRKLAVLSGKNGMKITAYISPVKFPEKTIETEREYILLFEEKQFLKECIYTTSDTKQYNEWRALYPNTEIMKFYEGDGIYFAVPVISRGISDA